MSDRRSPDAIQREIEATRAELADTIDAIADRVSPKKAAGRGAAAMKAKASAAIGGVERAASDAAGSAKDAKAALEVQASQVVDAAGGKLRRTGDVSDLDVVATTEYNGQARSVLDATPEQAARGGAVAKLEQRTLRTDRVLFSVGAVAAAAAVVVLFRSRNR